jgi:hypothetical protein
MTLTIKPRLTPQAAAVFTDSLLPRVNAASGFVAGYWVDQVDGDGFGFLVFFERRRGAGGHGSVAVVRAGGRLEADRDPTDRGPGLRHGSGPSSLTALRT